MSKSLLQNLILKFPPLYDPNNLDFHQLAVKQRCRSELLELLKQNSIDMSPETLIKRISNFNLVLRRRRQRLVFTKSSNASTCNNVNAISNEESTSSDNQTSSLTNSPALEHIVEEAAQQIPCKDCGKNIKGFRYVCVQCADVELCGACEARETHAAHYGLRIPGHRPQGEVEELVSIMRAEVERLLSSLQPALLPKLESIKSVIKEEPGLDLYKEDSDSSLQASNIMEQAIMSQDLKQEPEESEIFIISDPVEASQDIVVQALPALDKPGANRLKTAVKRCADAAESLTSTARKRPLGSAESGHTAVTTHTVPHIYVMHKPSPGGDEQGSGSYSFEVIMDNKPPTGLVDNTQEASAITTHAATSITQKLLELERANEEMKSYVLRLEARLSGS